MQLHLIIGERHDHHMLARRTMQSHIYVLGELEGDQVPKVHGLRGWASPSVKKEWLAVLIGIQDFGDISVMKLKRQDHKMLQKHTSLVFSTTCMLTGGRRRCLFSGSGGGFVQ